MKSFKNVVSRGLDWGISLVLGVAALMIFLFGLADYVAPGQVAHLMCAWNGLIEMPNGHYPLLRWFYQTFKTGQYISPIAGFVCVVSIYHLVTFFIRENIGGDYSGRDALTISRIGGVAAALVFTFTPSVRYAATHLDVNLFDAAWGLLAAALLLAFIRLPTSVGWIIVSLAALMVGFGTADTLTFGLLFPFYLTAVWVAAQKKGGDKCCALNVSLFTTIYLIVTVTIVIYGRVTGSQYLMTQKEIWGRWFSFDGAYLIPMFSTLPFFVAVFACRRAFRGEKSWMMMSFHGMLTLVSILALLTSLSASALMSETDYSPVVVGVFTACTAGYLLAFWWAITRTRLVNESTGKTNGSRLFGPIAWSVGGFKLLLLVLMLSIEFFFKYDARCGAFADSLCDRMIADMGEREWFLMVNQNMSDLEDQIRLSASKKHKDIKIINLFKALVDVNYKAKTVTLLQENGLGRYAETLEALSVNEFITDWFKNDPDVTRKVVLFDCPELWYEAPAVRPVPELLFFGGDPSRIDLSEEGVKQDLADREAVAHELAVPDGWDSMKPATGSRNVDSRCDLRRHLGYVTCWRGNMEFHRASLLLADPVLTNENLERATELQDRAYDYYDLVLKKIDPANMCALFNQFELVQREHPKAIQHKAEIDNGLKKLEDSVVSRGNQRYDLMQISRLYGQIMNPKLMMNLGIGTANAGEARNIGIGEILQSLALLSLQQRALNEIYLLAPLYEGGYSEDREKAREIYKRNYDELRGKDELDLNDSRKMRVTLIGLARLALYAGNKDEAMTYLLDKKITEGADSLSYVGRAILAMIADDIDLAKDMLDQAEKLATTDSERMSALALKARVVILQMTRAKNLKQTAEHDYLKQELEDVILAKMKDINPEDLAYLSITAAMKISDGSIENLKAARDDLNKVVAKRKVSTINDMILNIDVVLNDEDEAVKLARKILIAEKDHPFANWVLGSVAMRKNDLETAARHLEVSVKSPRPVIWALNDYAELLRRRGEYGKAEELARRVVALNPELYSAYETIAGVIVESGDKARLDEAEKMAEKAFALSKNTADSPGDVRMLITLARIQRRRGNIEAAQNNLLTVKTRQSELGEEEKKLFMELLKGAE